MDTDVILKIQNYVNNYLFDPDIMWPVNEFKKRSYSRWAAYEILDRIKNDLENRDPINNVVEFLKEVRSYSELCTNDCVNFIFTTAIETAEDIIFLLLKGDKKWVN